MAYTTDIMKFNTKVGLGAIGLFLAALFLFFKIFDFSFGVEPRWGVTFSTKYATELGLNWEEAYIATLRDLKVKQLRIPVYWDEIEPLNNRYNFSRVDRMLELAKQFNAQVVLAIGRRVPRWPECHDPLWSGGMSKEVLQQELLTMVQDVVERYRNHTAIVAWQVENEPTLEVFGMCPPQDMRYYAQEVAAVRALDNRPIVVTDSGELSLWQDVSQYGDYLGVSLYRVVWNQYIGFWRYTFTTPAHYWAKAQLVYNRKPNIRQVFVSELQMEPWTLGKDMIDMTPREQYQSFSPRQFKANIAFARATGMPAVYLWGVEYWYWQKTLGNEAFWLLAQDLWR